MMRNRPPDTDLDFSRARRRLRELDAMCVSGRVTDVIGLVVEATGPGAPLGSLCRISTQEKGGIFAEVVGFRSGRVLLMPLGDLAGVSPGSQVMLVRERPLVGVGDAFRGRIVDGLGRPLDGRGPIEREGDYPLYGQRMNPLERRPIDQRAAHLRPWPAARHLRGLGRREERAPRDDGALHARRRERHRARRRAWP